MRIAFIGFGEAGRAFHASLAQADPSLGFACYDILFDTDGMAGATARAAAAAGIAPAASAAQAAAAADWVVSAVTADSSLDAARSVADALGPGRTFLDVNSVSPGRKREAAALIEPAGAAYVDVAVMAPVHPHGHRTPVLLGGGIAPDLAATLSRLGFRFDVAGPEVGSAAAIKLVRSIFMKGLEAITVETLLAAEATGCMDRVARSLQASFPGLGWPGFAAYEIERSLRHGTRRAAEMRESARMLDELGLDGTIARTIAAVHARMGALGATPDDPRFAAIVAAVEAACADPEREHPASG